MATYTFDGPNKLIQISLDGPVTTFSAIDLYSRWKEWVLTGDNAKFLEAFADSVGGNELDAVQELDGYFFLRNDLGWLIRPAEANHELVVNGNLFGFSALTTIWSPTVGNYNVQTRLSLSSRSTLVESNVSGLTAQESADLDTMRKVLVNRQATSPDTGLWTVFEDDNVTVFIEGALWEDVNGTIPYRGRGIELREKLT